MTGYRDAAPTYLAAGWTGVLPLPPRAKAHPPAGYTGRAGIDPSPADVQTWCDFRPADANLALRLPTTVVGIDVDAYGGKPGAATLARLEADLGPLPPTVMSTSRDDGTSGIRLYRVPARPAWSDPGDGVEIIHHGWRYLVAWPSIHDKTGALYRWWDLSTGRPLDAPPRWSDLPELPAAWVEHLARDQAGPDKADAASDEVVAWLDLLPAGPPCQRVTGALDSFHQALEGGGSRHAATLAPVGALVRLGERGHPGVPDALSDARGAFLSAVTAPGAGQRTDREAVAEWRRGVAGAYRIVKADPTDPADLGCRCVGTIRPDRPEGVPFGTPSGTGGTLAEVVAHARTFLDLPDPSALIAACAAASTRDLPDDPCWLLIVGPASSGKTEAVRVLDTVADARLDDVSAAGLLSWKAGKKPRPVGILTEVPTSALATFGDLSSLLATSDRGGREQTFGALRRVYDGYFHRSLGTAPEPLVWEGRLTVVAAVTDAIDRYAAAEDALGPRWLYLRLPPRDLDARRRAARAARTDQRDRKREQLAALVDGLVAEAARRAPTVTLPEHLEDEIEDAALVTCWGRAAVPRHGYGRREIDGLPSIEDPGRIVRQLRMLATGALACGLDLDGTARLVRRVALDSMPAARRTVLEVLADGEKLTTSEIARRTSAHRHVARRQLEELESIGVAVAERDGAEPGEDEPDRRASRWRLHGPEGALVAQVIAVTVGGGTKCREHPPVPPDKEGGEHEPSTVSPTLRATPEPDRGAA